MLDKGVENIRIETDKKAEMIYSFLHKSDNYFFQKKHPDFYSKTTICVDVKGGSNELIKRLKAQGVVMGNGYEIMKDKQIRIGNFPAHSLDDVKSLLKLL
jgi:phosphoserine aminotransferase